MNGHAEQLSPSEARQHFSFGQALDALKDGAAVARLAWNDGVYIKMQRANECQAGESPRIYFNSDTNPGRCLLWHPEQGEILANDWYTVPSWRVTNFRRVVL